jgi:cyclic lactone autoinducer peptide
MSIRVMKLVLFALVLLSSAVSSNCFHIIYQPDEMNALHAIFGDWNQSTPNVATNLPGWDPNTNPVPCFNEEWKGVLCVRNPIDNSPDVNLIVVAL